MRAWQNYVLENTCPGINLIDVFKNISTNNGKYYPAIFEDKNIEQVVLKNILSNIIKIVSKDFIFRYTIITPKHPDISGYIDVALEHIVHNDIKIYFSVKLKLAEIQLKSKLDIFDIAIHKGDSVNTFKKLEIKETSHDY